MYQSINKMLHIGIHTHLCIGTYNMHVETRGNGQRSSSMFHLIFLDSLNDTRTHPIGWTD